MSNDMDLAELGEPTEPGAVAVLPTRVVGHV